MDIKELEQYKSKLEKLTRPTNGCWYYEGTKEKNGRGVIKIGKKMKNVALMVWELTNNQILPEGFQVKNTCGNIECIRPDHLEMARRTFPWRI